MTHNNIVNFITVLVENIKIRLPFFSSIAATHLDMNSQSYATCYVKMSIALRVLDFLCEYFIMQDTQCISLVKYDQTRNCSFSIVLEG